MNSTAMEIMEEKCAVQMQGHHYTEERKLEPKIICIEFIYGIQLIYTPQTILL